MRIDSGETSCLAKTRRQIRAAKSLRHVEKRRDVEKLRRQLDAWPKNDVNLTSFGSALPSLEISEGLLLTPKGFRIADNLCGLFYSNHRQLRFWRLGNIRDVPKFLQEVDASISAHKACELLQMVSSGSDHRDHRRSSESKHSWFAAIRGFFCVYRL